MTISVTDISDVDIITSAAPCVKEESREGGLQKPFEICSNNLCFVNGLRLFTVSGSTIPLSSQETDATDSPALQDEGPGT